MQVFKSHIRDSDNGKNFVIEASRNEEGSPFNTWRQLPTLKESARLLTGEAMRRANGNQSLAAEILGVSPPALSERLKRLRKT